MTKGTVVSNESDLAAIVRLTKSVAVIGMVDERKSHRAAYQIPLILHDYGIRVIPVNPKIKSALDATAYPDLASVPEPFDLVNLFRRSEDIEPHANEVLALPPERRPLVFWMQSGIRNDVAAEKLVDAGITVVMDHCLGVYVARYRTRD
jgi:predicted CoA-binding protein